MKLLWKKSGGSNRVIRGGGWSNDVRYVRASDRDRDEPGYRDGNLGFRCVTVLRERTVAVQLSDITAILRGDQPALPNHGERVMTDNCKCPVHQPRIDDVEAFAKLAAQWAQARMHYEDAAMLCLDDTQEEDTARKLEEDLFARVAQLCHVSSVGD